MLEPAGCVKYNGPGRLLRPATGSFVTSWRRATGQLSTRVCFKVYEVGAAEKAGGMAVLGRRFVLLECTGIGCYLASGGPAGLGDVDGQA